jgi:hypothetical protein
MAQYGPRPQSPDSREDKQLRQLLNQALGLADHLELPPEIGARLQEVVDMVEIYSSNH